MGANEWVPATFALRPAGGPPEGVASLGLPTEGQKLQDLLSVTPEALAFGFWSAAREC